MATRKRRELVNEALALLIGLSPGETPADEDFADVDAAVPGLLDRLEKRNVVGGVDPENIEAAYFEPLAVLLANALRARFSAGAFDVVTAESELRQMSRPASTDEPIRVVFY